MKSVLPLLFLLLGFLPCTAQTLKEWFKQKQTQKSYLLQQIAGLQYYIHVAEKGYQLIQKGTQTWHSLQSGKLHLDRLFFDNLQNPDALAFNPEVSHSTQKAWIALQATCQRGKSFLSLQNLNPPETRKILFNLWEKMLQEGKSRYQDQQLLLTKNQWSLQSEERLHRLAAIQQAMILLLRQAKALEQGVIAYAQQGAHLLKEQEHLHQLILQYPEP